MDQAETLRTLAETGVAFTGFTGVVAILGDRSSRPWVTAEITTIRGLFHASAEAALLPFLPLPLERFLTSGELTWRVSAAFFTVYHVVTIHASLRGGLDHLLAARWVALIGAASGFLSITATSLLALGLSSDYAPDVYAAVVFQLLVVSALQFGGLLLRRSGGA